jgi:pilus assembly protein CpaB
MIGLAGLFGLLAVFIAQSWLHRQAQQMQTREAVHKPAATQTIVVASKPLRYGVALTKSNLQEIEWPQGKLPQGAFSKIDAVLKDGKRVALAPIEVNEPVLAVEITGPGQRATLSALVRPGMKAVTIRVNDVEGVGGFVLPGDHVDVVMTRQVDNGAASTEVVLQDVRVLAIDQTADVRTAKPSIAKAVTIEVNTAEAQKIWLASSVGKLSLLLRKAGEVAEEKTHRMTLHDLLGDTMPASKPAHDDGVKIVVMRGSQRQEYNVPKEERDDRAMATVGQSRVR